MNTEISDAEIVRVVRENPGLLDQVCSKYESVKTRIEELEQELLRLKGVQTKVSRKPHFARKPSIDMTDKIDMIVEAVKSGNSNRRSIMNKTGLSNVQYNDAIIEAVRSTRIIKNGDRSSTFYTLGSP